MADDENSSVSCFVTARIVAAIGQTSPIGIGGASACASFPALIKGLGCIHSLSPIPVGLPVCVSMSTAAFSHLTVRCAALLMGEPCWECHLRRPCEEPGNRL